MKRREFIGGSVSAWVGSTLDSKKILVNSLWDGKGSQSASGGGAEIENKDYHVVVDEKNGALVKIEDKKTGINLITEPRLADNFSLLIPLADLEGNYILGREQNLSSFDKKPASLTLIWNGPLVNPRGSFDIAVTMTIRFVETSIQFSLSVKNETSHQVAEAWYPILGGFTGFGERRDTHEMIPYTGGSTETDLFKSFQGRSPGGGLGMTYVETFWGYPNPMPMPWLSIQNKRLNRTLYFACYDTVCRYKVVRFELHPGVGSRRYGGNWPRPEELTDDTPLGLKLHWAQFPYIKPHESYTGPPVVLQFHDGDWHDSAKIYRQWFKSHFTVLAPTSNWMRQKLAFVDTMFMLPEGNISVTFRDIPKWAKGSADYGITSVLISGWQIGGHDGNYPYYEPDPRLGTWDELAQGIRECHKMGLKVYFFANIQPVRVDTEWYKRELYRYTSRDKWGVDYSGYGFGMGSLSARLGYTRPPLIGECSGIPAFRKIIVSKMRKLAEIGADGLHIDKVWPHPGLDYNPLSTLPPDQATSMGRLKALDEILQACRAVNPEFALSTECAWDSTLPYANVAWAWHDNSADHVPMMKYTFPEWFPGLVAPQPFDYTPVNNAVRYGYQIFMGPGNYIAPDSMAFAPMRGLSEYVRALIGTLEPLKETIAFGEFHDTQFVQFDGATEFRYSVFRNPNTGKRACVVVNMGEKARRASVKSFDGNMNGSVTVYQPSKPPLPGKLPIEIEVPSERLAIVMEG